MEDIFLGAITDEVVSYDGSGVVQPGSSTAPSDTSVTDASTTSDGITPDNQQEQAPAESSNNWIMYLGVGIMAYVLLFKKK